VSFWQFDRKICWCRMHPDATEFINARARNAVMVRGRKD
jgi:hypothetical protein